MLLCTRRAFLHHALMSVPAIAISASWPHAAFAAQSRPGAARRIAAPDRGGVESVLALGIVPIAGPPADFYRDMGGSPSMPVSVASVGYPVEPNLEMLKALGPDLIVTVTIDAGVRDLLNLVAPVMNLDIYTGQPDAYGRAAAGLLLLADRLGVRDRGALYVSQLDASIARIGRGLTARGARPAYLVTLDDGGRTMTVYGKNSIMYDVMAKVGVPNAWEGATNGYGFTTVGIEKLAQHPDADLLYVDYGLSTAAALARLSRSPFWRALPMVRAGRVHAIPLFDVFGSLPLAQRFANHLAVALSVRGIT